jgi:hypothetical protein
LGIIDGSQKEKNIRWQAKEKIAAGRKKELPRFEEKATTEEAASEDPWCKSLERLSHGRRYHQGHGQTAQ